MSDKPGRAAAHQAHQQPTPTPYPDVNAVVQELLTSLHAIVGAQVAGMYLVGSLALGDFQPRESDLDLVIVTVGALSDEKVAALRDLHQRFDHSPSAWAAHLDAVYIPQEVLREPSPSAARYPVLGWPEPLVPEPLEDSWWPFWRYTLREHGVVVSGPDPRSLLDPVQPDDLRRASAAKVAEWRTLAHGDPAWVAGLQVRQQHTYVVVTLCRLLYTLHTGAVASKPVAARWAARTRASRWSALIDRATTEPRDNTPVPEDAVSDTLALLEYTFEQYRQWPTT
ncbi:MAG TPA: aminoglycoside adenylyltransferase domain-containing protein [Ktedonobacterales bacterium]